MASTEHKELALYLKEVHSQLRKLSSKLGADEAWSRHCENQDVLNSYAHCMEKLATTHWEENCSNDTSDASSRIKWAVEMCYEYFTNKGYLKYKEREAEIALKINAKTKIEETFSSRLKLIDVGSCYNPFKLYEFDVLAIDLCPANDSVLQCDFINVPLGSSLQLETKKVTQLPNSYFEIVTFCFLLEYIPSSELRIKVCDNAYNILKPGGLLIISTPDSKHIGANSKLMKCWRYALALMGFSRIKYEKLRHMHCMAFRKSLHTDVAVRWAHLHKEPSMEFAINIPQDFNKEEDVVVTSNIVITPDDFKELPFCDSNFTKE